MKGRLLRGITAAAALSALVFSASPARAVDRRAEAAAKDAIKRAANDYLSTDYTAGAARLERAARTCGASRCTAATKATVLRDLGTMQFRNGDVGAAKKTWADAVKLQPELALNPDYDTPDLRTAWDDAKAGAGSAGGSAGGPAPQGDFTHTPPSEQKAGSPLPLYAEYPGGTVARVVVKYKSPSAGDWSRMDLKKMGGGWGGQLPCADVTKGTLRYWIQGFDEGGDPVASSGDPKHPFTVAIKDEISGEAPHLPGKAAPKACNEDSDCPPGLPGCAAEKKGTEETTESETGEEKPKVEEAPTFARFWVGISAEVPELMQMTSGDDLCGLTGQGFPANSANAYCTNPDGSDFPSRAGPQQNSHLVPGAAGHSDGGIQFGDVRVMATFDYALNPSMLVGARLGYVFNAYTGQSAASAKRALSTPIHAEARFTLLIGHQPLMHTGFAPMGFAGLGFSEFDVHTASVISLDNVAGQQPVNIWLTDAPFFLTAGAGMRYAFSLRAAFTAAARVNLAIGGNGTIPAFGPEVGILYGF